MRVENPGFQSGSFNRAKDVQVASLYLDSTQARLHASPEGIMSRMESHIEQIVDSKTYIQVGNGITLANSKALVNGLHETVRLHEHCCNDLSEGKQLHATQKQHM